MSSSFTVAAFMGTWDTRALLCAQTLRTLLGLLCCRWSAGGGAERAAEAFILTVNDLCLKPCPGPPDSHPSLVCLTRKKHSKLVMCSRQAGRPTSLPLAMGGRKDDMRSRNPLPRVTKRTSSILLSIFRRLEEAAGRPPF